MFEAPPGTLVHYRYDRCIECEERFPIHIPTRWSLYRTSLHRFPTTFTYCPRCQEAFRHCVGDTPCIM